MKTLRLVTVSLFGALMIAALAGCNGSITFGDGVAGTGDLVTDTYALDGFDAVAVEDTFDAYITAGDEYRVEILSHENVVEHLDVRVRNGVLKVGLVDGISLRSGTLEAVIQLPLLEAVDASGATNVQVSGVDVATFDLQASGSSDIDVESNVTLLRMQVSGSSDVTIVGTATTVDLEATGSSDIRLRVEGVDDARLDISGASSVDVLNAASISGSMTGAADLVAPATASLDVRTSGASSIRSR